MPDSAVTSPDIITFGCRLNAYESEVMKAHAVQAGLGDAVVFNTCAVTSEAVRKAEQAIRKAHRDNPRRRIIVTGCAAQTDPGRFARMPEVAHVLGNGDKLDLKRLEALRTGEGPRVAVNDIMSVRETASHLIAGFGTRARTYVEVQNGCDHRCTFCVIPYGRGPSRSVPAGEVVSRIRALLEAGCREIVLTGVDITAYGADLPGGMTLGKLVQKVLKLVPELPRLRLSSIDSVEADAALLETIAGEPRLMPHLHLSLQAGHDLTLKRMKRRHSREDAIAFSQELLRRRPDAVLGADLIAGFPTETEEMFEASLALVADCGLTYLHVFPYSARKGTAAARMPQVKGPVIRERARRLREAGKVALDRFEQAEIGRTRSVLVESRGIGRTPQFAEVAIDPSIAVGTFVDVRINGRGERHLTGQVLA
ncbi:MAG: tRNA (N(6)-L-threonylcarbamoyladenosine(37)-C(2))-methylthiotransferase MtaB [Hyphomicrobiaceae bacterium]